MNQTLAFKGSIYYASQRARDQRLYKEGRDVTISNYDSFRFISPSFVEINFDNTGTNYIHLQLEGAK